MAAIAVYLPFIFAIIFKVAFLDGTLIYSDNGEISIGRYTEDAICGHHELQGAYFEMETYLKKPNETSELYISHGKIFFFNVNDTKIYLTVSGSGSVLATEDEEQAALFTIRTWNEQCPGGFFIDYTWSSDTYNNNDTLTTSTLSLTPKHTNDQGCEESSLIVDDYQSQKLFGCSDVLKLPQ